MLHHRALHRDILFADGEIPGALVLENRYGEVIKGGDLLPGCAANFLSLF